MCRCPFREIDPADSVVCTIDCGFVSVALAEPGSNLEAEHLSAIAPQLDIAAFAPQATRSTE